MGEAIGAGSRGGVEVSEARAARYALLWKGPRRRPGGLWRLLHFAREKWCPAGGLRCRAGGAPEAPGELGEEVFSPSGGSPSVPVAAKGGFLVAGTAAVSWCAGRRKPSP